MIMFGGSPTRVDAPPIFEAKTWDKINGTGETFNCLQTTKVIGTASKIVVTLSKIALAIAVKIIKKTSARFGSPFAFLIALIARYSNNPVLWITPTIIIMPSNRKITFQSIPVS